MRYTAVQCVTLGWLFVICADCITCVFNANLTSTKTQAVVYVYSVTMYFEERCGSVLNIRLRGHWFKTHRRHCVFSLSYNWFIQVIRKYVLKWLNLVKIVDWGVKHQHKQTSKLCILIWRYFYFFTFTFSSDRTFILSSILQPFIRHNTCADPEGRQGVQTLHPW